MSLIEPSNRTADLSALKIQRDSRPDRARWVFPAVGAQSFSFPIIFRGT